MIDGEAKIHIRKAQLHYLYRQLNLDETNNGSIDDKHQIFILRIEESKISFDKSNMTLI